ncbi:tRNA (mnm(5)s(2)U34)-methyltransferase [Bacillus xiapuensis]|uniref:tRNA (mnm(5)s(2)U34)-methyltransferase n=1 Tax=Bacillus xiapuensis TaxID=2014075 RepID=UPI000C23E52D|nr:class I SAM-dependent methyltransferase [Bacillus xiapuensis]
MNLDGILPFARKLLEKTVKEGSLAIDATIGNGHDTVFLARLVGESGHVFGFDVQQQALERTAALVEEHSLTGRTTLFHRGHEQASASIPEKWHGRISGAIFNLGYLPKGDKSIVTKPETTIQAVEQIFSLLQPGGLIVLVIYHGHAEGAVEKDKLLAYVKEIDQKTAHVLQYQFINQVNHPPFIIAIERR